MNLFTDIEGNKGRILDPNIVEIRFFATEEADIYPCDLNFDCGKNPEKKKKQTGNINKLERDLKNKITNTRKDKEMAEDSKAIKKHMGKWKKDIDGKKTVDEQEKRMEKWKSKERMEKL